jgi:hypothetical protein
MASQIQIERIFSIVGIMIPFFRFQLQIENLDKLIFINKNWPHDPCVGCTKFFDFAFVCEVESYLIKELDAEFTNEV